MEKLPFRPFRQKLESYSHVAQSLSFVAQMARNTPGLRAVIAHNLGQLADEQARTTPSKITAKIHRLAKEHINNYKENPSRIAEILFYIFVLYEIIAMTKKIGQVSNKITHSKKD